MSLALERDLGPEAQAIRVELERRRCDVLAALAVQPDGLPEFCRLLWEEAQPGRPVVWGWYLQALCERLMAFLNDPAERELVINVPPRTGKSTLISVLLPAWVWLQRPQAQFIAITKAHKNVQRDARGMRHVVTSAAYQRLAQLAGVEIRLSDDQNQVEYFATRAGGHRISLATGGDIIGTGADLMILDDPHDPADLLGSPEQVGDALSKVSDRFEEVWTRRLNPGGEPPAKVLIVMQRLHDNDLAGVRLREGASGVVLPMEAEAPAAWAEDPRLEGELLVPRERFSPADELAARANPMVWAGQFQQRPVLREGGLFQVTWFTHRWTAEDLGRLSAIVISIDATFKDTAASDFCVLLTAGRTTPPLKALLLDLVRRRMDYPTLRAATRQAVEDARRRWPGVPVIVLVEDKANGPALVADLQKELSGVVAWNPGARSKYERAQVGSVPWFQASQVLLPPEGEAPWERGYVLEHLSFPRAAHDDQVDATSQALLYWSQHAGDNLRTRQGGGRRDLSEGGEDRDRSRRPRPGSDRRRWG